MFRLLPVLAAVLALAVLAAGCGRRAADADEEFLRQSTLGKAAYEGGRPEEAVAAFARAVALQPVHPEARQNLANALLRAGRGDEAAAQARELLALVPNSGAGHYLLGAALLRAGRPAEALPPLQTAKDIDRTVNNVSFLMARAHQELGQFEPAAALFEECLQFEPEHPSAAYQLAQVLNRLGRADEAARWMTQHQSIAVQRAGTTVDQNALEACAYTEIRVPFRLEQPDADGVPVTFKDATAEFLGSDAPTYSGPVGVIDINHDGRNDLFTGAGERQFRLLRNEGGKLTPQGNPIPATNSARYARVLVGDLNKDRYEDIVVLGEDGLHAFRLATNGAVTDATAFSNLRRIPAADGLLLDLDFTGNLDLLIVNPANRAFRVLRNLGNMYFRDTTATSGVPALAGVRTLLSDDWDGDGINDLVVGRDAGAPELHSRVRGGGFTNAPIDWPSGGAFAMGDLNNDLRPDLAVAGADAVTIVFNGLTNRLVLPFGGFVPAELRGLDFDNDGWLDLVAAGDGLRVWRNAGQAGFREVSDALGLAKLPRGRITSLAFADLDQDGDTDLAASVEGAGLKIFRNDGGNANRQLKLRLVGNRSNSSGLGMQIELTSGHWRTLRTVHALPVEIGVGRLDTVGAVSVRWFDTASTDVDVQVSAAPVPLLELIQPTGSCPYLYAWDGERFRFVTDLLGAAPVGLPAAEGFYIQADPDEIVRVGDDASFRPREGAYVLEITEELREVLYLDEAKLLVVDHPPGTEVHPTDKLVPGRPFPPTGLMTLKGRVPLRRGENLAGDDVTAALQAEDREMASPTRLRAPQLRGHAEPHGVVLDFGPLDPARSLVLAMTGWLRFGGGMANMAAARDPDVPFPFPKLEAELADGSWRPLDFVVGAPIGKTKTMLVDLTGRLPEGVRRLRWTAGFEIHWDRIALFERAGEADTRVATIAPDTTDLRWRGYSDFADLPWTQPLTPDYDVVRDWPDWRLAVSGWCTRYGAVDELIARRDGGLAILNGGDALELKFSAAGLPPRPAGAQRAFFLFTVGWDKDADFHVRAGDRVEPLPWEGMDDQRYGTELRPPQPGDELNRRFNTRWVGPVAQLRRK
ncbi:MAG: FG-GAP-like repeat-containing protein [Limisphaerales bacterium]